MDENSAKALNYILRRPLDKFDLEESKIWFRYKLFIYIEALSIFACILLAYKVHPILSLIIIFPFIYRFSAKHVAWMYNLREKLITHYGSLLNDSNDLKNEYSEIQTKFKHPYDKAGVGLYKTELISILKRAEKNKKGLEEISKLLGSREFPSEILY